MSLKFLLFVTYQKFKIFSISLFASFVEQKYSLKIFALTLFVCRNLWLTLNIAFVFSSVHRKTSGIKF